MLVEIAGRIALLHTLEPPDVVVISFAAERTRIIRRLDLLPLVKNISLVHMQIIVAFLPGIGER
jgi:hypothetical protein